MIQIEDITKCASCGNIIDTSKDKCSQKSPCSECGSTIRNYHMTIMENLQLLDGWGVKGKRPGKKKPFVEDISMPNYSHSKNKLVLKEQLIDRDNDKYREKISDYQTRETIHYCEEPLSQHFGHGSAKFKKEK